MCLLSVLQILATATPTWDDRGDFASRTNRFSRRTSAILMEIQVIRPGSRDGPSLLHPESSSLPFPATLVFPSFFLYTAFSLSIRIGICIGERTTKWSGGASRRRLAVFMAFLFLLLSLLLADARLAYPRAQYSPSVALCPFFAPSGR